MKRLFVLLAAVVFALAACGEKNGDGAPETQLLENSASTAAGEREETWQDVSQIVFDPPEGFARERLEGLTTYTGKNGVIRVSVEVEDAAAAQTVHNALLTQDYSLLAKGLEGQVQVEEAGEIELGGLNAFLVLGEPVRHKEAAEALVTLIPAGEQLIMVEGYSKKEGADLFREEYFSFLASASVVTQDQAAKRPPQSEGQEAPPSGQGESSAPEDAAQEIAAAEAEEMEEQ